MSCRHAPQCIHQVYHMLWSISNLNLQVPLIAILGAVSDNSTGCYSPKIVIFPQMSTVDAVELLRKRIMCRERLESNANAELAGHFEDRKYIEELEKELGNCSQEIGYLQDQLNLRNVEANYMAEHVHSLELKLEAMGKLNEKIRLLNEELVRSESKQLILMQELKFREEELQDSVLCIEQLETSVSSISLDSECELESLKLNVTALEQRCFEAERISQEAASEKDRLNQRVIEYELRLQDAKELIGLLERENMELRDKLAISERKTEGSFCKVGEQLVQWLKQSSSWLTDELNHALSYELRNGLPLSSETCACGEVLGPFVSKLAAVIAQDDKLKVEMEKMSSQIHESELLVKQLKEELREEKLKAKEDAEDLTQEMAELRYQITSMLEEECKRRACIEQASLLRIQELESQVRKEREKSILALRRFQKANDLAEMRSMELMQLKDELEGYRHGAKLETASADAKSSPTNNICDENESHWSLIEWQA
ncbi:hypothetical protein J5N97_010289 [Dioscorea zingiberensis]|uniref:Uncharacterized protein n=1 Tax=Dioscorea zingiberensis TaxID=325984 RepID=A0A9D5CZT5_9LILI|nr:hypothetical protein J5N97_010289 [Dioscorea zingiberensis]